MGDLVWNKQPCQKQADGAVNTDWCLAHDQSIWTCVETLRTNMYRVRDLYEKKIKLLDEMRLVDQAMKLEGGDN